MWFTATSSLVFVLLAGTGAARSQPGPEPQAPYARFTIASSGQWRTVSARAALGDLTHESEAEADTAFALSALPMPVSASTLIGRRTLAVMRDSTDRAVRRECSRARSPGASEAPA